MFLLVVTAQAAMGTPIGYEFTGQALREGLETALSTDPALLSDNCRTTDGSSPLSVCGIYAVAVTAVDPSLTMLSGISPVPGGSTEWGVALDHFSIYGLSDRVFVEYHDLHNYASTPLEEGDDYFPACSGCTEVALLTLNASTDGHTLDFEGVRETMAAALPMSTRFRFTLDGTGTVQPKVPVWVQVIYTQLTPTGEAGIKMGTSRPFQLDAEIPEPASLGLCALGLGVAAWLRRRAKRS